MSKIADVAYNFFYKRTSTFIFTSVVAAFFFERGLDIGANALFEKVNQGKLWSQLKHKYE